MIRLIRKWRGLDVTEQEEPKKEGRKAPTVREWEMMLMRVVFEGIAHKLHNGIPLTEDQQRVYDKYSKAPNPSKS
jgi:hypothetical protein